MSFLLDFKVPLKVSSFLSASRSLSFKIVFYYMWLDISFLFLLCIGHGWWFFLLKVKQIIGWGALLHRQAFLFFSFLNHDGHEPKLGLTKHWFSSLDTTMLFLGPRRLMLASSSLSLLDLGLSSSFYIDPLDQGPLAFGSYDSVHKQHLYYLFWMCNWAAYNLI